MRAQVDKAALLRGLPVENVMALPIDSRREEIVSAMRGNQVVIVVGETGSGKTTRIPVFLYEAGFAKDGIIGVCEPRKIAVTSVASHVARQLGSQIGNMVGYQVRFDNQAKKDPPVKFMTDGILLRDMQIEPDLSKYSVIMVDEAHERSQNIDFVLGLLKDLLKRRPELRVVVASATIDSEKFSRYFAGAPVIEVSGRVYPVEVVYEEKPVQLYDERDLFTTRFMIDAVVRKITHIHKTAGPGDVLAFMAGKDDIDAVVEKLEALKLGDLRVLPVYGGLSADQQFRIFANFPGKRKVVVATNIAETSITINGVAYVVDSGIIKQTHFHGESGIQSLDFVPHSQAGCNQRKGRAGRTRAGTCFRMYTQKDFESRPANTDPEILRVSLAGVVLAMEDIGIKDVERFEFIDPPESEAFHEAYQTLIALGAIAEDSREITEIGRRMACLPLEPRIARMVIEAQKYGCIKEVATIAAFLSAPHMYVLPPEKKKEARAAHIKFRNNESDLLGFLSIWTAYERAGSSGRWCFDNYLNNKSLSEAGRIRQQLLNILSENGIPMSQTQATEKILKSVASGLAYNLLELTSKISYAGLFRQSVNNAFIHPGSALWKKKKRWVIPAEIVRTTQLFARNCTAVKIAWLPEILPHFFAEKVTLLSLAENEKSMKARRKVIFKRRGKVCEAGTEDVSLSFAEAKSIQEKRIAKAESKGWQKIIFTSCEHGQIFCNEQYVAVSSAMGLQKGTAYYCQIMEEQFMGRKNVVPKFTVFNFPE